MTIQSDMALLAAGSYWDIRGTDLTPLTESNRAPLPAGWQVLTEYDIAGSGASSSLGSGFSARVYKGPGGEVVISYAGTEIGATLTGFVADCIRGNVPMAIGQFSTQVLAAAQLYQRVKSEQGGNITFTGHSLGGGLASVMAVLFDRPAYVFAAAPFQASADSTQATVLPDAFSLNRVLPMLRTLLGASADPKLTSYDPATDFTTREANVQAFAVKGELLEAKLGMLKWIEATPNTRLYATPTNALDESNKHSIDLHAAALITPNFETQAGMVPSALQRIFDTTLYGLAVTGNQQNFLVKLVRNEVGVRSDAGVVLLAANGMLAHYANDLGKLGTSIAGLNTAAQDALIAQGIEWYYWQGTGYAGKEFFKQTGNLLQYTTAIGDDLPGAKNKAASFVDKWLTPIFNAHDEFYSPVGARFDQWNVVAGSDGATAGAVTDSKSQLFIGGDGPDNFTGGINNDLFLGGAGADTLNGGAGWDRLYGGADDDTLNGGFGSDDLFGGAGSDTYELTSGEINDTIQDSDGNGKITVDGVQLTGGKKKDDHYWISDDKEWGYLLTTGGDLVISKGSSLDGIRVKGWQSAGGDQLGIHLDDAPAPQPVATGTFTLLGDQAWQIPVYDYLINPDGTITGCDPRPNGNDEMARGNGDEASLVTWVGNAAGTLIEGTFSNVNLQGLGGNDILTGMRSDDELDGGEGSFTQPCGRTRRASVPARLRARGRGACGTPLVLRQHRGLHADSVATANWLRRSGPATRHVCGLGWVGAAQYRDGGVHSMRVVSTKWLGRRMDSASSTLSNGVQA